ncbi:MULTISPECIES: DUF4843 domain-containing protein [Niastella]|uniref:DUF4843 domain-containing protein n=1 Tax=Niastella soli TaxID=2821487 RepID=A0ABS3YUJ6_9BACT|nr:DUF4843 domain-containing protein [Niastella soli]MBO9201599.1 DUF4843 domain-containing protein [Niastella soli]
MAKKIKYLYILLLFGVAITACKKSNPTSYTQADRIYFYKDNYNPDKDSIVYSFAIKSNALVQDTVKIPLRIMGVAAGFDRTVTIQVVADSSTALPQQYDLLPTIVKAGDYTTNVQLLVNRAPALKTADVRLLLEIGTSDDFLPGVYNSATSTTSGGGSVRFPVRINDILTKPSNWDGFCATYFGAYSQVKYKLVIDVTGRTEFLTTGDDPVSIPQMNFFKKKCRNYLTDLNTANGINLKDENGNEITFPN